MKVGDAIKSIRKERRLKQSDFATHIGISQTYLSQIENNKRNPNISILETIGKKLEIPLPVIMFLAIEESDVSENKREVYNSVNTVMKDFISKVFL